MPLGHGDGPDLFGDWVVVMLPVAANPRELRLIGVDPSLACVLLL